jgi:hypothetical protein
VWRGPAAADEQCGHGDQVLKIALTLAVAGFAAAYAAVFGPR